MKKRFAAIGATLAAVTLVAQPALAADPKLPDTLAWSAYDVGSGGYNQAVAIGAALKNKYGTNLRIIPGKNDV
ncbi:MAG: C4-dicarboxylate ABC transporter, partial [Pseudomonadota bacterium]|nr:C4-dicarboxylate ABC transporter [Pseudomonadota bacterium]